MASDFKWKAQADGRVRPGHGFDSVQRDMRRNYAALNSDGSITYVARLGSWTMPGPLVNCRCIGPATWPCDDGRLWLRLCLVYGRPVDQCTYHGDRRPWASIACVEHEWARVGVRVGSTWAGPGNPIVAVMPQDQCDGAS